MSESDVTRSPTLSTSTQFSQVEWIARRRAEVAAAIAQKEQALRGLLVSRESSRPSSQRSSLSLSEAARQQLRHRSSSRRSPFAPRPEVLRRQGQSQTLRPRPRACSGGGGFAARAAEKMRSRCSSPNLASSQPVEASCTLPHDLRIQSAKAKPSPEPGSGLQRRGFGAASSGPVQALHAPASSSTAGSQVELNGSQPRLLRSNSVPAKQGISRRREVRTPPYLDGQRSNEALKTKGPGGCDSPKDGRQKEHALARSCLCSRSRSMGDSPPGGSRRSVSWAPALVAPPPLTQCNDRRAKPSWPQIPSSWIDSRGLSGSHSSIKDSCGTELPKPVRPKSPSTLVRKDSLQCKCSERCACTCCPHEGSGRLQQADFEVIAGIADSFCKLLEARSAKSAALSVTLQKDLQVLQTPSTSILPLKVLSQSERGHEACAPDCADAADGSGSDEFDAQADHSFFEALQRLRQLGEDPDEDHKLRKCLGSDLGTPVPLTSSAFERLCELGHQPSEDFPSPVQSPSPAFSARLAVAEMKREADMP